MRRCRRWSRSRARRSRRSLRPSNGFKIERSYFTLDGKPADVTKAKQNDRFAVVLKITEAKPEFGHIMVADYLPAGLEIDNPHLVSSGDPGTLDWIEDGEEAEEHRVPRRPLHRGDRPRRQRQVGVHGGLRRARGVAGQICAAAGLCRGHVQPSRYGRTGTGSVEVTSGEMSEACEHSTPELAVMPGLDPGIHGSCCAGRRRGWPGQARP